MSTYFETRYTYDAHRTRIWKAICEYIQPDVPVSSTIAEFGAGYCDFINQIRAEKKFAVDINADVKKFCNADVVFCHSAVGDVQIPDNSIDIIFASNLLEHLDDQQLHGMFKQVNRILRSGGRFILMQPNYYYCYRRYWDDFTHVKAYSHESLPDMLVVNGFRIDRVEKRFLPFSFRSSSIRSYWLTKIYLNLPWRPFAAQMLVVARKNGA